MATDERNFRSTYYEKVGFKSVEEKRSLEILLKEKPLDVSKLKQFCLRFGVPIAHRNLVWKLLLGILPIQERIHDFVIIQRKEEYLNLLHALEVLTLKKELPKPKLLVAMWFLHTGKLKFENNFEEGFSHIIESMLYHFESDIDVYWFARAFYATIQKFQCEVPKLVEATHTFLEKDDNKLYKHLSRIDAMSSLPFESWFTCCFAGVLNDMALGRIWDKIMSGSYKILVYTAVVILTSLKHKLMKCTNINSISTAISNISEDLADVIVNKSLELWQQQGSPLTVYDKPKP